MSLFQLLVGPFTLSGFLWSAWKCVRGPGRYVRVVNGLLALAWAAGSVLVIDPGLASALARVFGIGRGVDLVFYIFMVAAFCYAIRMYYRLCDMRKDITLIVRHIAIAERRIPAPREGVESSSSSCRPKHEVQQDL
jgi:hypothetical protein